MHTSRPRLVSGAAPPAAPREATKVTAGGPISWPTEAAAVSVPNALSVEPLTLTWATKVCCPTITSRCPRPMNRAGHEEERQPGHREQHCRSGRGREQANEGHAGAAEAVGDPARRQRSHEGREREGGGKHAQEHRIGAEFERTVADHQPDPHPRRLREDGLRAQAPPPGQRAHARRGISSVPPNSRVRSSMLSRAAW